MLAPGSQIVMFVMRDTRPFLGDLIWGKMLAQR